MTARTLALDLGLNDVSHAAVCLTSFAFPSYFSNMRHPFLMAAAVVAVIWGWVLTEPVHASDWIVVGKTTDKSTTLIDAASLQVTGSSAKFFSKTIYSASDAQHQQKVSRLKSLPAHTINGNIADCRQRTLAVTQWVDYGKKGQVLSSGQPVFPTASAVIPDSIGEAMLNLVCGATQN